MSLDKMTCYFADFAASVPKCNWFKSTGESERFYQLSVLDENKVFRLKFVQCFILLKYLDAGFV